MMNVTCHVQRTASLYFYAFHGTAGTDHRLHWQQHRTLPITARGRGN